jgi:hypothetical protein
MIRMTANPRPFNTVAQPNSDRASVRTAPVQWVNIKK